MTGVDGVAVDTEAGLRYVEVACKGNLGTACSNLGTYYLRMHAPPDPAQAAQLLAKACDLGRPPACDAVGDLYLKGNGVDKNHARAAAYYKRACDGGLSVGCHDLQQMESRDGAR